MNTYNDIMITISRVLSSGLSIPVAIGEYKGAESVRVTHGRLFQYDIASESVNFRHAVYIDWQSNRRDQERTRLRAQDDIIDILNSNTRATKSDGDYAYHDGAVVEVTPGEEGSDFDLRIVYELTRTELT